jgi:hypothetical protein
MYETAPVIIQTRGTNSMVFAYLDATTGTLIVQTIIAAAVAIPFILRTQLSRAISVFRKRGDRRDDEGQGADS